MKVWILFLIGSFLAGCIGLRREWRDRAVVRLGLCVLVAGALYTRRFA